MICDVAGADHSDANPWYWLSHHYRGPHGNTMGQGFISNHPLCPPLHPRPRHQPALLLPQHRGPAGDQDSLQEVAAHTERGDWPDVKQARENVLTYFKGFLEDSEIFFTKKLI